MTNYDTKRWKKAFRKFARRGGRGARKALSRAEYNAFTVAFSLELHFHILTAAFTKIPNTNNHCRRRFDRKNNRLNDLKSKVGRPNYYTEESEENAFSRTVDRLSTDKSLVPATTADNMLKALVREVLLEELQQETVRYSRVVRARRQVRGRPGSAKFCREVEKRHQDLTAAKILLQCNFILNLNVNK